MAKIDFNFDQTLVIARNLDAKDGKRDGKISASVWNEFVKDKGGKTIKYSITVEDAQKSIATYLARNSKESGKSKVELGFDWMMKELYKGGKYRLDENGIDPNFLKNLTNLKDPKVINETADNVIKFISGKSEHMPMSNKANAAQVFDKVLKSFDGKLPLTLATHLYLGQLYPALLKQAADLGIQTEYDKDTNFGHDMLEICKNKLSACIALKNQICAAEKAKQTDTQADK